MLEHVVSITHGRFTQQDGFIPREATEGQPFYVAARQQFAQAYDIHCLAGFFTEEAMQRAFELAADTFANLILFGVPSRNEGFGTMDRDTTKDTMMLDLRELQVEGREDFLFEQRLAANASLLQEELARHAAEQAAVQQMELAAEHGPRERVITLDRAALADRFVPREPTSQEVLAMPAVQDMAGPVVVTDRGLLQRLLADRDTRILNFPRRVAFNCILTPTELQAAMPLATWDALTAREPISAAAAQVILGLGQGSTDL